MKTEKDYWTLLDQLDVIEKAKNVLLTDHNIDLENASDAGLKENTKKYWNYMHGSAVYWANMRAEFYGVTL